jgi:Icc-related predicted phosphoesterase
VKLVAISDVHTKWKNLVIPECDILISAGDYSFRGEKRTIKEYHEWLNKQDAGYIVSVQGNHELWVEKNFEEAKAIAEKACPGVHFIGDHGTVDVEGIKIHGSAITPWFHSWAWNVHRGPDIAAEWAKIPDDTNILVTHGPVHGILDVVPYANGTPKERVGCHDLFDRVMKLEKLKVHICGHIHHSHGFKEFNGKHFYNVAICDEMYMPINPITIIEY